MQTMRHENEESRAEYFRQWGRQLEKETSVLRDAVRFQGFSAPLRLSSATLLWVC